MKVVFVIILFLQGLIHFMGFAKDFDFGNMAQFTKEISKPIGFFWLLTGLLFIVSVILYIMKKEAWSILAIVAGVLSQILIFMVWNDAKFGTIANVIIPLTAIIGLVSNRFENTYKMNVLSAMEKSTIKTELVSKKDLEPLPLLVQRFLNYVGVVGKPKVYNVRIIFEGEMRDKGKDWFSFTSEQYNFFETSTRLFFMKAKVKGLPTNGYHKYDREGAGMLIKLLFLFPVVDIKDEEMYPTETVIFF